MLIEVTRLIDIMLASPLFLDHTALGNSTWKGMLKFLAETVMITYVVGCILDQTMQYVPTHSIYFGLSVLVVAFGIEFIVWISLALKGFAMWLATTNSAAQIMNAAQSMLLLLSIIVLVLGLLVLIKFLFAELIANHPRDRLPPYFKDDDDNDDGETDDDYEPSEDDTDDEDDVKE